MDTLSSSPIDRFGFQLLTGTISADGKLKRGGKKNVALLPADRKTRMDCGGVLRANRCIQYAVGRTRTRHFQRGCNVRVMLPDDGRDNVVAR